MIKSAKNGLRRLLKGSKCSLQKCPRSNVYHNRAIQLLRQLCGTSCSRRAPKTVRMDDSNRGSMCLEPNPSMNQVWAMKDEVLSWIRVVKLHATDDVSPMSWTGPIFPASKTGWTASGVWHGTGLTWVRIRVLGFLGERFSPFYIIILLELSKQPRTLIVATLKTPKLGAS